MQFNYIEENLLKIIENPESVMYIKAFDTGKNRALFAVVKEGEGSYRKIQITKGQSRLNFPVNPIDIFNNDFGSYLENFIIFDKLIAFNKSHFEGLKTKPLNNKTYFNLGVFAIFDDGTATHIINDNDKKFEENGGTLGYRKLLDKKDISFSSSRDTYEIIEFYSGDDDTFIIPSLKQNNNKQKVYTRDNYKKV